jgi:hypothetical protein
MTITRTAPRFDSALWAARWQRFSAAVVRGYHAYAGWLVSISWRRFVVLAVMLLIAVGIVHDLPPFTWTVTEHFDRDTARAVVVMPPAPARAPAPAAPPAPPVSPDPGKPTVRIEATPRPDGRGGVEITIGKDGVKVVPKAPLPAQAASAAETKLEQARQAATAATHAAASAAERSIRIVLPSGASAEDFSQAVQEVKREIEASLREAKEEARNAIRDAEQAVRQAETARAEAQTAFEELTNAQHEPRRSTRVTRFGIGDVMMQFTFLWVLASAILKFTYKGRLQAEVKAAQATETAEAESLKRQVVEARMAAMQAQVEPHFLFNTLASIDHLIETDPARASQMQKNLIALLRASMPTMREASGQGGSQGVRDLGREVAVIRPYLEILKVRMEERLSTEINVPEGLLSAEFPPMMVQTLVENAIKHGLEPKPEGGHLRVSAEIVHGKLQMTVADTGLGFGKAATAGTGVGLANIRERLQLLYGPRASLTVAENQPSGTVVTVTVPYKTVDGMAA